MSNNFSIHNLPYFADSSLLFQKIVSEEWAIFLDSGFPYHQQGRYDIFSSQPTCKLVTHGEITTITKKTNVLESKENPFELIQKELSLFRKIEQHDLPFDGGAMGYFSYDLARRLEKLPSLTKDAENIPEMMIGIYEWAVIVDHQEQKTILISQTDNVQFIQEKIAQFNDLNSLTNFEMFEITSEIISNSSKENYQYAFNKIKRYLKEGDCYQVNLTQRFSASCVGNAWLAYQKLREINAAPFSAYLNFSDVRILSSSPERFLKVKQGFVETKPIKGTRPRKQNSFENQQQLNDLIQNPKDRAENVMIVDLLRNDIGKVCKTGTVKVPNLFAIESYATVHHLVSTIIGELKNNHHALTLLENCFPGGSITGAPKIRAMEIIEEIETYRRGVYCGAIGYISFNGNMDTNIAIRTFVQSDNTIRFWAGGGIVYDSQLNSEYQESFDKAAALFNVLKSFIKN